MIEITEVDGRYEVLSPDRHWEAFDCKLSAHAAALALAAEVEQETGTLPRIAAPWALYPPIGSVCRRLDGLWLSYTDRHRWRDHHAIAPTREVAMRWAERWCWARAGALATAEPERMPGSPEPIRTFRPPAQKSHGSVRPNDPLAGITIPALGLDE